MDTIWQDLKYAARTLRKNAGFSAIGVLALALGVGANTAIFSVADAFLFKPLPFHDLGRLAMVLEQRPYETENTNRVSPALFFDWKAKCRSFDALAAYDENEMNLTGEGTPEKIQAVEVTANFFDLLGSRPATGRTFRPGEDQPGHETEVVLGHGLWVRRFGADPNVLGRLIELDNKSYTVIGVMPKSFNFPETPDAWFPMTFTSEQQSNRAVRYLLPIAHLKSGVTLDEAQAEMRTIAAVTAAQYPEANRDWSARVIPMRSFVLGNLTEQYTKLLMGAVFFVLLIVCANVANLQFARASGRHKEVAVRAALGASRWRIVRQLLTESVLLALAAGVLSLLVASWAIDLIVKSMPADVAKYILAWEQIHLDARALAFTLAVAVISGVISGIAPALRSSQPNLEAALRESGRSGAGGRTTHRLRSILVVAQISLALILMVGAGLMAKGFRNLISVHQDLQPDRILTMSVSLPDSDRYKTRQQRSVFIERAMEQFQTLPGASAAVMSSAPYSNDVYSRSFVVEGQAVEGDAPLAIYQTVNPEFFRLMNIPLRSGRLFDSRDALGAPETVIISENLARRFWPGEDPLGHRIRIGLAADAPWVTIVGVVGDFKYQWVNELPTSVLYRPYLQAAASSGTFALRVQSDSAALVDAARTRMAAVDPQLPLYNVKTLDRVMYESTIGLAYVAVMLSAIGFLGLVLSAVGVYAVMAFAVSERTQEFGIRMALGAGPNDVLRLALRRGVILTVAGFTIGLPVAIAFARMLAGLLYGISSGDVPTLVGTSLLLAVAAGVACYVPAHRATRVDPLVALRYE